jgi:hypothetical protein
MAESVTFTHCPDCKKYVTVWPCACPKKKQVIESPVVAVEAKKPRKKKAE